MATTGYQGSVMDMKAGTKPVCVPGGVLLQRKPSPSSKPESKGRTEYRLYAIGPSDNNTAFEQPVWLPKDVAIPKGSDC